MPSQCSETLRKADLALTSFDVIIIQCPNTDLAKMGPSIDFGTAWEKGAERHLNTVSLSDVRSLLVLLYYLLFLQLSFQHLIHPLPSRHDNQGHTKLEELSGDRGPCWESPCSALLL